jgi:predicted amidohydrolase
MNCNEQSGEMVPRASALYSVPSGDLMPVWKAAAVQMDCRLGDKSSNLAAMRRLLARAADAGARLIVFPEAILTGYGFDSKESAWPCTETLPGPATHTIAEDCQRFQIWTAFGLLERAGDRLFNSCALVGPDGFMAGYRKAHLPFLGIDRFAAPGDQSFAIHDLGGLRIGINICYDAGFPEAARCLALAGADLIVLPTNWPPGAKNTPRYLVPARALENNVYYLAANRIGEEAGFRFIGQSLIVDVTGDSLASAADDQEQIIHAEIDPNRARAKRVVFVPGKYEIDRINHRRPDLYGRLCEPLSGKN